MECPNSHPSYQEIHVKVDIFTTFQSFGNGWYCSGWTNRRTWPTSLFSFMTFPGEKETTPATCRQFAPSQTPFFLPLFVIFKMFQKTALLLFDFEKAFYSLILTRRTCKIFNSFLSTALSITFLFFLDLLALSSPCGWADARTERKHNRLYDSVFLLKSMGSRSWNFCIHHT